MKCTVHFYLLNDHYSQEYADERYDGKESEMNRKHEWEDELVIKEEVTGFSETENAVVPLAGTLPSGEPFDEKVERMRLFTLHNEDQPVAHLSCSEVLFDRIESETKGDEYIIRIYLKDNEPLSNPVPGMYIAAQEFPKSLIF